MSDLFTNVIQLTRGKEGRNLLDGARLKIKRFGSIFKRRMVAFTRLLSRDENKFTAMRST